MLTQLAEQLAEAFGEKEDHSGPKNETLSRMYQDNAIVNKVQERLYQDVILGDASFRDDEPAECWSGCTDEFCPYTH